LLCHLDETLIEPTVGFTSAGLRLQRYNRPVGRNSLFEKNACGQSRLRFGEKDARLYWRAPVPQQPQQPQVVGQNALAGVVAEPGMVEITRELESQTRLHSGQHRQEGIAVLPIP